MCTRLIVAITTILDTLDKPMSPEVERRVFGVLILHPVFTSVSHAGPARALVVVHLEADQRVRIRREQSHGFHDIYKEDTSSMDTIVAQLERLAMAHPNHTCLRDQCI